MLILIIDNNKLVKEKISSNYVYKKIIISKKEINLLDDYSFNDGTHTKELLYTSYEIINNNIKILLFIYKDVKEKYILYDNKGFTFGKDSTNSIVSFDPYIDDDYLILKDNIIQTNSKFAFVNSIAFNNTPLKDGDIIELFSFRCIYYKDFLYTNNLLSEIKISKYIIKEKEFKYEIISPQYNNYYIDTNNELIIDKLKDLSLPHKSKQRNIFIQLGSSLTMSLAMCFLAYINIERHADSNTLFDVLAILVMPLTMLVSSILWPIISNLIEKREYKKEYKKIKNEYYKYLHKYEKIVENKINKYLLKEYDSFFYKNNILKKLFYIQNNSKDFETISLGLYTKHNDYKYDECDDEDINGYIKNIFNKINNIDNHPLRVDIKKHKIITINADKEEYIFNKYLLELVTKYHYNDLQVCIYDKTGKNYKNIYNLPHLFNDNNRLTFSNERDLQILNNSNKETIVLAFNTFDTALKDNCHVIYFTKKQELFKNSDCVIEYKKEYGILNETTSIKFNYFIEDINFDECFEQISYYYIPSFRNKVFSFNDFYSPFDIENNYLSKQKSLTANFATTGGELINFDLHENNDGPHGLIGGSTGSGKSELIVSLLLSLCIKYRPDYLNIILIDYKGGGIANSLSYKSKTIPHLIGEITNLSEGSIERLIFSLSSECKKREEAFKCMSSLLNTSITNIDEYIDFYDKTSSLPKIAHLLIVVDEFAELKKTNPEIIKQLVSFSRIGRSLGIHLILSTQKPNGVIDDEIWSNSHFKIALKLHDEKDSRDIIKSKDAAYIKNPGEFILQVDNISTKAESLYSKRDYYANKEMNISLLDEKYNIKTNKIIKNKTTLSEAMYYSLSIINTTDKLNIKPQVIDFEKPNELDRKLVISKSFVMGTVDDYLNAKKYVLDIPLNENLLIYSSRENEINNMLNILNENKIESVVLSHRFIKGGYIKDCVLYDENDKISFIFNNCQIENKKIYLIIEDFSSFVAYDDGYAQYIYRLLKKSSSCNIKIILLTKHNISNYKIINSFNEKFIIKTFDQNDLINFFGRKSRYINDSYYYSVEPISFVPCRLEDYKQIESKATSLIKEIPNTIELKEYRDKVLIGFDIVNREEVFLDKNEISVFVCKNKSIYNKLYSKISNKYYINLVLYDSSINLDNYKTIVWIGEGIFKQRLFLSDLKDDLHRNEGYIIREYDRKVFRLFDYE